MNRKLVLLTALIAGLPLAAGAQASPAVPQPSDAAAASQPAAATAPAQPAPVAPTAYPAKIALIAFTEAVMATNEGQQALAEIQKKYEPKQVQLEGLNTQIEGLKKQLQAAPATLSDDERSTIMKSIDTKQKQLDRDSDDDKTAYQADLQEAYGKVAQKFYPVLQDYVEKNGYTVLLNVSEQQGNPTPVMWTKRDPNSDITEAVIAFYNASHPVAASAPSAPSATHPKPAATPHTTPKPPSQ